MHDECISKCSSSHVAYEYIIYIYTLDLPSHPPTTESAGLGISKCHVILVVTIESLNPGLG